MQPHFLQLQRILRSRSNTFISLSATHVISVILFVAENDQHNVSVIYSNTVSNSLYVIARSSFMCEERILCEALFFSPSV